MIKSPLARNPPKWTWGLETGSASLYKGINCWYVLHVLGCLYSPNILIRGDSLSEWGNPYWILTMVVCIIVRCNRLLGRYNIDKISDLQPTGRSN